MAHKGPAALQLHVKETIVEFLLPMNLRPRYFSCAHVRKSFWQCEANILWSVSCMARKEKTGKA